MRDKADTLSQLQALVSKVLTVNLNRSKNNKIQVVAPLHPAAFRLEVGGG
jgi:hypothetical protein